MRRGALLPILLLFAFLAFAIHLVWNLLGLLFIDGSDDMITKAELPAPGSSRVNGRSQLIPKIIHQTYKNETIPVAWQDAQASATRSALRSMVRIIAALVMSRSCRTLARI